MRLLLSTALIFSTAVFCLAQKNIPLPEKDGPPELPLEPDMVRPSAPVPAPAPGLPKMETGRQSLPPQGTFTPAPRVKLTPRSALGEASVQGGQFRVHGKIKEQRDRLLEEAESTRRLVAAALRFDPVFTFPIVLQIRETSALRPGLPQIWSNVSQIEGGFRFEINLVPQNGAVPGPLLREELVRCILAEMMLRDHAGADLSGQDVPPPDWLLYGLLEMIDYQSLGRPSDIFSTVFRLGRVLSVDDIFSANPRTMDSVSRTIYRSSCCGLLLMLMEQHNGRENLAELLRSLALMSGDDAAAIARAYPKLTGSGNSLGKWWSLQLATMAQPGLDELLNTRDTEAELVKALTVQLPAEAAPAAKPAPKQSGLSKLFGKKKKEEPVPDKKVVTAPPAQASICSLEEFPTRILPRKDRAGILGQTDLALTQLAMRAHPLYRPVVAEYLSLVKALAAGKREKEAAGTLASLAKLRKNLKRDMDAIEDYVDWYEATQMESLSGDFREYLDTAASLAKPPPPRRDPISRYMNLMESEFKMEE